MNTTGQDFIQALCNRLKDEGKLCTDNEICVLLRSLDRYEVNEIINFGITAKWKRERLEKMKESIK